MILLVGDLHAADKPPRFCTDAYLSDIHQVLHEAIPATIDEFPIESVVFVGDVFHHKAPTRTSHRLVMDIMDAFRKIQASVSQVYVVAGNHDVQHDRMESLEQSPLGVLERAGVCEIVQAGDPVAVDRGGTPFRKFTGLHWTSSDLRSDAAARAVSQLRGPLVVAHAPLYPPGQELKFEYWDIELFCEMLDESVEYVYYGHVHDNHGIWKHRTSDGRTITFCNHGAVSRGSISEVKLDRPVGLTVWHPDEGFRFISLKDYVAPVEELFRVHEHAGIEADKATAADWVEAVQGIHTVANSMGELHRALDAMAKEQDTAVINRAKQLLAEVDQGE